MVALRLRTACAPFNSLIVSATRRASVWSSSSRGRQWRSGGQPCEVGVSVSSLHLLNKDASWMLFYPRIVGGDVAATLTQGQRSAPMHSFRSDGLVLDC